MKLRTYILSLRRFRVWHRRIGTLLGLLFLISALTGILLALKKEVAVLQPPSQKGHSRELADWLPLHELEQRAQRALEEKRPTLENYQVDRLDVRPSKGMVKVLFEEKNWEVQLDGSQGTVLSIARRHSDWIEALHDGSIVSDGFKLASMHLIGIGLILLVMSGWWLWYGPRKVRAMRKYGNESENR